MFYIFNLTDFGANYDIWSDAARDHSHQLCSLWSDFAKYGRPSAEVGWEEYGLKGESLFLGQEMEMGVDEEMGQRLAHGAMECVAGGRLLINYFSLLLF